MKVLGIDPGYDRIGIAVIEKAQAKKDVLLYSDCFQTNAQEDFASRLHVIGKEIERLVKTYTPNTLAIEQLFFNTNQKTALRVAEVRGMILYLARTHDMKVCEYTPSQIKQAVSGYGKSDKAQVAKMIPQLIALNKEITLDDEFDAIAVGLTCTASERGV